MKLNKGRRRFQTRGGHRLFGESHRVVSDDSTSQESRDHIPSGRRARRESVRQIGQIRCGH